MGEVQVDAGTNVKAADVKALVEYAINAAKRAYAPYSHYAVGAVLRAMDGTLHTGCNVENASYPAGICAERTALVKAVSEGKQQFDVIVVASSNGGTPCGVCRQMLFEFAPDLTVIVVDFEGQINGRWSLSELLLHGFGPSSLAKPHPTTP